MEHDGEDRQTISRSYTHGDSLLLRARGAPGWALEIASNLECPECRESAKPKPRPPASLGESPNIFEVLGTDVFEFEDDKAKTKMKFILWRDRGPGLCLIHHLQTYAEGSWEPTSEDVIRSMMKWQMTYPSPRWVFADAARYYTSTEFMEYLNRAGVGLTIAPAEAHWLLGNEESAIGVAKRTVERLQREGSKFSVPDLFSLAASAMNGHVGASGFSAFQWAFGSGGGTLDDEKLLVGIQPGKAFQGLVKERERAKIAFEKERAVERFSKLANAVGRQPSQYKSGQLVMLWRQRVKPGKMKGNWTGPMRLILMEGTTAWLSSGATLIRAKVNQIRPVSQREEMTSILEGTAAYRTPVTVESLMRSFTGRYFKDVTGDTPSEELQRQDLQPSQVLQEPDPRRGVDSWGLEEDHGKRTLVRYHVLPRLALFNPLRAPANCPVSLDDLVGTRTTLVRPPQGGTTSTIKDTVDIQRNLPDRWVGETRFELVDSAPKPKRQRVPVPQGEKRKAEKPLQPGDGEGEDDDAEDVAEDDPAVAPSGTLTQALRSRGPDVLDGTPIPTSSSSSSCRAPGCILPGGHAGHHKDQQGAEFLYDQHAGQRQVVSLPAEELPISSSSSSTSSEELLPDEPDLPGEDQQAESEGNEDSFVAIDIPTTMEDFKWLSSNRNKRRGSIWLSKKMSEKGKEVDWMKLPLSQKKEFDTAMAREISQVIISKALRDLNKNELARLDSRKVMSMRWVLTRKSTGEAKARLVILGFQAPNITEIETASPTMSKVARHLILSIAASLKFRIKCGDVTSAFLQTGISLEDEELSVWAPPELAAMFAADPQDARALRVREAFYGLCHAPRKWWEKCVMTMKELGWKQLKGDKCAFVLMDKDDPNKLVGVAGIHVDDFLIGGDSSSTTFSESEAALLKTFRWGKWQEESFEFAGVNIRQNSDYSIFLDQESYTQKWLDEINIDKTRARSAPLQPSEISALRGALGTMSWRATQSGPQFLAETSLLLSEIIRGTVETLYKTNKLIREMKHESKTGLLFPSWGKPISKLCVVTWADASQHNRPDKSNTVGILTAVGPREIMDGDESQLALVQWRSGKTPRQCLGSNGAEVQAITIGEDQNVHIRMLLAEFSGVDVTRENLSDLAKIVPGAVVMDSRGIYDAMVKNISPLHGLRDSRSGYELTLSVNQSQIAGTKLCWVNGLSQLADSLTKAHAKKTLLQFLSGKQFWRLVHDPKFESGRRVHKREMERKLREMEQFFVQEVKKAAMKHNWPWTETGEAPVQYDPYT